VNSSRAPASPILLKARLPIHRRKQCKITLQASFGDCESNTTSPLKSTSQPHSSVISDVLICSAAPRSRAPSSPMLLPLRLPIYECEHWPRLGGLPFFHRNCNAPTSSSFTFTSTSKPHSSVVSAVLTCSAAPRSRAPVAPTLLQPRLPMSKCEHCTGRAKGVGAPLSATETGTHPHRLKWHPHPHHSPTPAPSASC
jgi:hypothetical protein